MCSAMGVLVVSSANGRKQKDGLTNRQNFILTDISIDRQMELNKKGDQIIRKNRNTIG